MAVYATAQSPFTFAPPESNAGAAPVGGRTSVDLVRVEPPGFIVPLRNGGLVEGSELVYLDGRPLVRSEDYAIDYDNGTVFLLRPARPGQSLRVSYRFDPERSERIAREGAEGFSGFKLNMMPGAEAMIGYRMPERGPDGRVTIADVYGLANSFSFGEGRGGLTGAFFVTDRRQVRARSLFESKQAERDPDEGRSHALIQQLETPALGGTLRADYQDVSAKFTSYGALRKSGFSAEQVAQFQRERGLQRRGLSLEGIGVPGLRLSHGQREVRDGDRLIEWRTARLELGPLGVDWNRQRVDPDFSRFKDLREADREQLAKERGLERETLAARLASGPLEGTLEGLKVQDKDGNRLARQAVDLRVSRSEPKGEGTEPAKVTALGLRYFSQYVGQGFTRFGDLRENDRGQLAREQGLRRELLGLEIAPWIGGPALRYSNGALRTDAGRLSLVDLTFDSGRWALEHRLRRIDPGFRAWGSLTEAEVRDHVAAIARMYTTGDPGLQPHDFHAFPNGAGLERAMTRLTGGLGAARLGYEELSLRGPDDGARLSSWSVESPRFALSHRALRIGESFDEIGRLMPFEQARLGTVAGLRRDDWALRAALGGSRSLAFSRMTVRSEPGDVFRETVQYQDKGFSLAYARRRVDAGFAESLRLVDPERELLNTMRGFSQTDLALHWTSIRNLDVRAVVSDAAAEESGQERLYRHYAADWRPDPKTQLAWLYQQQRNDDPAALLFLHAVERWSIARDLGRYGRVQATEEKVDYDGEQTDLPDRTTRSVAYETKLTDKSALRTEHSETRYSDGTRESTTANTVSAEIGPRTGVSLTDVRVRRDGDKPDETRRNYGFWWDFGRNLRFSYGYARQLDSTKPGHLQSSVQLTPGQFAGLQVGQASYQTQRWDGQRFQSVGLVQVSTVRPFEVGPLKDVTFSLGVDTVRDQNVWQRENQSFVLRGRWGANQLGYDYRVHHLPGHGRAIERAFSLRTDPPVPEGQTAPLRAFSADVVYKLRTLPGDQQVMIRNYALTWRPSRIWTLTHVLQGNLDVPHDGVPLGSVPQPIRANRWKLDYAGHPGTQFGASWEEIVNDQARTRSRTGALHLTLFAESPSPLRLFYGLEQLDQNGVRRTNHRYWLRFDQRPGPNQSLNLFLGNVSWQHSRPDGQDLQNWTARLEYHIRF